MILNRNLKGGFGVIKVFDLSKNFGQFKVLKNINLEVNNGQILGLLGENGAGKSTFLRILSTMLKPSSGRAEVFGFDVIHEPEKVRKNVGILFGSETGLYERMTPKENIEFFGRLSGIEENKLKERAEFLAEKFGFKDYQNKLVGKLSKGMKQKVAVARAVVHDPSVILLDEPDSGLDFKASRIIFNFMQQCKNEGKSIIYSSHSLENIKNYSDEIAVIRRGEIIKTFSVKDFRKKYTEIEINEIILNWVCEENEND